jgi:hypothetical protein
VTALAEQATTATRPATLRTLGAVEARRYARHPLFLVGTAMVIALMISATNSGQDDLDAAPGELNIFPAFFLGLLGVFVALHLTRSMARSTDAVQAAPTDGITRTAALCLACLVPGAVALGWVVWMYVLIAIWQFPDSASMTRADNAALMLAGVVCAVGGPLVGVMVGRWTRFPGAGLLAAVALVGWCILGAAGMDASASRYSDLLHLTAPFTWWTNSNEPNDAHKWVAGGNLWWYLAYITLLCGLAATAAMLHEASGAQRTRLARALTVLAVLALASLGLAAATDPTRMPL